MDYLSPTYINVPILYFLLLFNFKYLYIYYILKNVLIHDRMENYVLHGRYSIY